MGNSRRHRTRPIEDLRLTIDCLPVATRVAMLEGIRSNERIIAGAYVDGQGGVCPMLAAHRCGGRTDFLSFAKSWDRFTRAGRRVRRATQRELAILVRQLESSLMSEQDVDLDCAIADHRALLGRSGAPVPRRTDVPEPSGEIVVRRLRRGHGEGAFTRRLKRRRERALVCAVPWR
jgi:hypothetical protein